MTTSVGRVVLTLLFIVIATLGIMFYKSRIYSIKHTTTMNYATDNQKNDLTILDSDQPYTAAEPEKTTVKIPSTEEYYTSKTSQQKLLMQPETFMKLKTIAEQEIRKSKFPSEMQISSIDTLPDGIIVHYASKEYIESGGDMKYSIPGNNPFFVNIDNSITYLVTPYNIRKRIAESLAINEIRHQDPDMLSNPFDLSFTIEPGNDIIVTRFSPKNVTDRDITITINSKTMEIINYEKHIE